MDLIYLDPPFNSKRDDNLLFKSPEGVPSEAQIEAFEDTWHWNEAIEFRPDGTRNLCWRSVPSAEALGYFRRQL